MKAPVFILYDARAAGGVGTDDASVVCVCDTESEAKQDARSCGQVACYRYDQQGRRKLINEQ